jgi:hypothetical protein
VPVSGRPGPLLVGRHRSLRDCIKRDLLVAGVARLQARLHLKGRTGWAGCSGIWSAAWSWLISKLVDGLPVTTWAAGTGKALWR